jgi:hypothetical protein
VPAPKAIWYVMIGGKKAGPLTRVDLGVEAATGRISVQNQVWKEGMEEWCSAGEVPDLAPLFAKKKKEFVPSSQKQAPPPPKKNDKGEGLSDFDTAHFRLADLKPEDQAASRQMEFDTSHFRLADLKAEDTGQNRNMEFDTAHFRLADLKAEDTGQNRNTEFDTAHFRLADLGQQAPPPADGPKKRFRVAPAAPAKPLIPQGKIKQASTDAVAGKAPPPMPTPPAMPKAAPRAPPAPPPQAAPAAKAKPAAAPPAAEPEWNPNSTVVDFRTLGELVRQQDVVQNLFESEVAAEPEKPKQAHAADLSRWAAGEMAKEKKAAAKSPHPAPTPGPKRQLPPPPVPLPVPHPSGSAPWVWPSVAVGAILAAALAFFLLWD